MNANSPNHRNVNNQDSEPVQPLMGIGYVDEVNRNRAEECPEYVVTRAELLELARYYAQTYMDYGFFLFTTGQHCSTGSSRRFHYSLARIARIARILGDEAVRKVQDGLYAEYCHQYGSELCEAWKRGDRDFSAKMQRELHDSLPNPLYENKDKQPQRYFDYLREHPSDYLFDDAGDDLWTFDRSEDGGCLVLRVTTVNGSATWYTEYSIPEPTEWTRPFGI